MVVFISVYLKKGHISNQTSYNIMIEISDGFQFNDGKEDHKMMLYSAFFSYDELINCAIAGIAFLAGT